MIDRCKLNLLLMFLLMFTTCAQAAKIAFDQKYVSVGIFTNSNWPQFHSNPNIRVYHGTDLYSAVEGSQIARNELLKAIFNCSNSGKPSIERLYQQALTEATDEETQIAVHDMSAEPEAVLKNDIARQLLKNNFIVLVEEVPNHNRKGAPKLNKEGEPKGYHYEWFVYHIDIDNEIINQVFYNWNNPSNFDKIDVPISFVAKGCLKKTKSDRIIVEISKKVPQFAIRGPIIKNHPTLATTTSIQGIRTGDLFRVYRMYEDTKGNKYSKKVSDARVLYANDKETRLNIIAGRYPNYKNGEIAALYGWSKNSIALTGLYSFGGNDPRIGGRITYEYLTHYSQKGISNYLYFAAEYQQYKKDPDGVWFKYIENSKECLRPQLSYCGLYAGYGFGINFLTKFEVTPYILGGIHLYTVTGLKGGAYLWDSNEQQFHLTGNKTKNSFGFALNGGIRIAYNLCYPFQLILGAEYGIAGCPDENYRKITGRHEWNRMGVFGGFRFNF